MYSNILRMVKNNDFTVGKRYSFVRDNQVQLIGTCKFCSNGFVNIEAEEISKNSQFFGIMPKGYLIKFKDPCSAFIIAEIEEITVPINNGDSKKKKLSKRKKSRNDS